MAMVTESVRGKSLLYNKKRGRHNTEPWGTPAVIASSCVHTFPTFTMQVRPVRFQINISTGLKTSRLLRFRSGICGIVESLLKVDKYVISNLAVNTCVPWLVRNSEPIGDDLLMLKPRWESDSRLLERR